MTLAEVIASIREYAAPGATHYPHTDDLHCWAAELAKYEPLIGAAEALHVTEPVEVPEYLKLRERVVSEALALFAKEEKP